MSRVFVDTNIFIYRRDPRDPAKQALADAWVAALARQRRGRISWQVLQEFYCNAARKLVPLGLTVDLARDDVRWLENWNPLTPDAALFNAAWTVQDRHGLSWWDALIVAAALRQGCTTLLSEDLQHGMEVDGVMGGGTLSIVNPFDPAVAPPG
ncbi:MAG: PIN domain-containing protein [Rhodocyclaceae bacterium]|nr:PIN domain-containing protein [Rhodocyclaceae bacterium]